MKLLDFADHEYINLITYKKDNTSVKTPVWVAEYDSCLVITSSKSAGKVKRINIMVEQLFTLQTKWEVVPYQI